MGVLTCRFLESCKVEVMFPGTKLDAYPLKIGKMGSPNYVNGSWMPCMCQVTFIYPTYLSNMSHVGIPIKTGYELRNLAEMQFVGCYKGTPTTKNGADAHQRKSWKDAW